MTVAEMGERMGNLEFVTWKAFFTYRRKMQDLEMKRSSRG